MCLFIGHSLLKKNAQNDWSSIFYVGALNAELKILLCHLEKKEKDITMRIAMVVDDEPMIRHQVAEIISDYGFEKIVEAGSGGEAISLAEKERPLLVMMDVSMPGGIDGITAAEEIIRKYPVPIVMLTGNADTKTIERARLAGVMSYVLKPINPAQVYAAVDLAIHQFVEVLELREEVEKYSQALETRKLIDRAKGVLIKQGMSEPAAYSKMQRTAMQKRKSMKEVAEAILLMEEF